MIEPMKTVTLVTLCEDQNKALEALRDLEIMHVTYGTEESADSARALRDCEDLQNIIFALKQFEDNDVESGYADLAPADLAAKASRLLSEHQRETDHSRMLEVDLAALEPWGNFDVEAIGNLRRQGIYVALCAANEKQMPEIPESAFIKLVNQVKDTVYFAVISQKPLKEELPEIKAPTASPDKLRENMKASEAKLKDLSAELSKLAGRANDLALALVDRNDRAEFFRTRDSMLETERLAHISGYIPARREDDLKKAAMENGWALQLEEPEEEDRNVPTLLKIPAWLNVSKPIFDLVGISPGYREYDVTACFLLFFTIFFAMIIGDGGYGAIFLLASLGAKAKIRKPESQSAINLFILLSSATLVWGLLTGNFFALPAEVLPTPLQGLDWFTDPVNGGKHMQALCFSIAVAHLSIAHSWKALALFSLKKPFKALGEIGWLAFVWGAFLVILKMVVGVKLPEAAGPIYLGLLGAGFVLMLIFSVDWKDIGDILNFPFGALGGFVDSLSYIRLFAVGLSGFYLAQATNMMAKGPMDKGGLMYVVALLILLVGHTFNMILCGMGVLVHGIRLNTLEFSGHLGLEWSGTAFAPFRKQQKDLG